MLAQALVMSRDLQLVGKAGNLLREVPDQPIVHTMSSGRGDPIRHLQPNIRALLIDHEIMAGLNISGFSSTPSSEVSMWLGEGAAKVPLVTIHRPESNVFKAQTQQVLSYADLRSERVNEILSQVVPQTAFWTAIAGLQPERYRYTYELLGAALRFSNVVVQQFKLRFDVPRPMEYSALVQPVLLAPGHTSFPSGHSTEAHCAAEVLSGLAYRNHPSWSPPYRGFVIDDGVDGSKNVNKGSQGTPARPGFPWGLGHPGGLRHQMLRLAYRVAENRVVAGLHYPMDSLAGQVIGITMAHYFLWRASRRWKSPGTDKNPFAFASGAVFKLASLDAEPVVDRPLELQADGFALRPDANQVHTGVCPVLEWLFEQAEREWR